MDDIIKNIENCCEAVFENAICTPDYPIPVFIVLTHSGSFIANAVHTVTGDKYSHVAISFDTSMDTVYEIGRKGDTIINSGFNISSFKSNFYKNFKSEYGIYVTFVSEDELWQMKTRLKEFIKKKDSIKYDLLGLFKNYFNIKSTSDTKYFCSRFVAEVLGDTIRGRNKDSSLFRPNEIGQLKSVSLVCEGDDFSKYNKYALERILRGMMN